MPYCSGDITSRYSAWFIAYHPRDLLCIFTFMSDRSMRRSLQIRQSLGYLCIRRSSTFLYLLGEYPVHQGKLNLLHPISASSGSIVSDFTIAGGISEGPEEVVSQRRLTLVMYCSSERGSDFFARNPVIETSFRRKLFVSASRSGIFCAVHRKI